MNIPACPNGCTSPREAEYVDKVFRRDDGTFVIISNLLAYVCEACGERSFPAASVKTTDAVRQQTMPATEMVTAEWYDVKETIQDTAISASSIRDE